MKPNRLIPLAVAFLVGLIAVAMMRQYLVQEERKLKKKFDMLSADYKSPVKVIVAARDIPENTVLAKDYLALADIPEKFIQPYATQDPGKLIGKITAAPIAAGEQVLVNKVRSPEQVSRSSTLSGIVPEGRRAVTIAVDILTGVGGLVRPGDSVDVLWTFALPQQKGSEPVTIVLFQDIPVLAIGGDVAGINRQQQTGKPQQGEGGGGGGPTLVTLALNPQETSFILLAREQGRIQLSLRSRQGEEGQVPVPPASLGAILQAQAGFQTPAPEPEQAEQPKGPEPHHVEVYKGLKKDVVVVPDKL